MQEINIEQLWQELQHTEENSRIEAKHGTDIGASIMQSVCAFANEIGLGGGYLLLGINEPDSQHNHYQLNDIQNSDQLLNTLQTNCRDQFEQPVFIQAQMALIKGKKIIALYVPGLNASAKISKSMKAGSYA